MYPGESFGLLPPISRSQCPDCGAPTFEATAGELLHLATGSQLVALRECVELLDARELDGWMCRRAGCHSFGIFSDWMPF